MISLPTGNLALELLDHSIIARRTVIQVIPQRPAEPNGVADYALGLARALRSFGTDSVILAAAPSARARLSHDEWRTVHLPDRQAQSLADTIQSLGEATNAAAVFLHFSGYGYQMRGAPLWLLRGLRKWRRRGMPRIPLVTIFHELYATGWPWQSSYWLAPIQKRIARGILNLSSGAITPTGHNRDWLRDCNRGRADIACMPVFSNVGEPGKGSAPCARAATAVVFGLAGVENRIYGEFRRDVERALAALGVERILDIGPRLRSLPSGLGDIPIISKGALPRDSVSGLLQQAKFGFVAYPLDAIGKSGVFAAYAAHGVVPIVFSEELGFHEGLEPGRHFIDGLRFERPADADAIVSMQSELSSWYASHSLPVQAEFFERFIMSKTGQISVH
jgi:Glycosyltransferase Family 4